MTSPTVPARSGSIAASKNSSSLIGSAVLAVDLDGTLLKTDMLWESLLRYLFAAPWRVFTVLAWLTQGRAHLKFRLAELTRIAGDTLPWNPAVVKFCERRAEEGATIVVATAASESAAREITRFLPFVSRVIGSSESNNLKSERKAARLVAEFGASGFDYLGDSSADISVWEVARGALFAGSNSRWRLLSGRLEKPLLRVTADEQSSIRLLLRAVRPHQWLKNLLVFFPLLAAHRWSDPACWRQEIPVFFALCCTASASYLLNDLSDLSADRRHHRKKHRPFAAGDLGIPFGIVAIVVLLLLGTMLAASAGWAALGGTALYFVISTFYSFSLKAIPVLDALVLSGLYTYRMILGGIAGSVIISPWLLAFSTTFFLGLAFLKRFVELDSMSSEVDEVAPGRGYTPGDLPFVLITGISSNFLSIVVLALYLESSASRTLYASPPWLWGIALALLFWIIRIWFLAQRKQMHDDPVWFAAKDWVTFVLGLACLAMIAAAGPA